MEYSQKPFLFQLRTSDRRSSILMLALWSLCILSVFAVILNYTVRQKVSLVHRLDSRDRAHLAAEAGVKEAIIFLQMPEDEEYLAIDVSMTGKSAVSEASSWQIKDEERKINVNLAGFNELARLFQVAACMSEGEAQDLAASIIDWRDSDSVLFSPAGGAEDPYYRNTSFPYEAKDAAFDVLDEILLVKGMSQDIFEKVRNLLTIYGDGRVNFNTASSAVLLALGLGQVTVDKILTFRKGKDGVEVTEDDGIVGHLDLIVQYLGEAAVSLTPDEIAQLSFLAQNFLTIQSHYFMINSRVSSREGTGRAAEVLCIVDREGKILYWKES